MVLYDTADNPRRNPCVKTRQGKNADYFSQAASRKSLASKTRRSENRSERRFENHFDSRVARITKTHYCPRANLMRDGRNFCFPNESNTPS